MNVSKSIDNRQNLDWSLTCVNGTTNEITEKKKKETHPRSPGQRKKERRKTEPRDSRTPTTSKRTVFVSRFFALDQSVLQVRLWNASSLHLTDFRNKYRGARWARRGGQNVRFVIEIVFLFVLPAPDTHLFPAFCSPHSPVRFLVCV